MRSRFAKVLDLLRLMRQVERRAWPIVLRREFERMGGLVRAVARHYRRLWIADTCLVAVVGSLGKTTTRAALHVAMGCPDRGFSYSGYGTALAGNLLRVRRGDRHAVIEAAIGGPGWMAAYARFLQPDIVVVTAIASDHHRAFPTLEDTRNEKAEMVRWLNADRLAVLNGDDPHVRWMATQTQARVVTFGLDAGNDVRADNIRHSEAGMRFEVVIGEQRLDIETRLLGSHMVYPFLAAMAVADLRGANLAEVARRLAAMPMQTSRMQVIRAPNGVVILDDCYKGGLESLHAALKTFGDMPARRKLILYGGIDDAPGRSHEVEREIGRRMGCVTDRLLVMSSNRNSQDVRAGARSAGLAPDAVVAIGSGIDAAYPALAGMLRPGDALLVKGRGPRRLRRVVLRLLGRPVHCAVDYCILKVASCDVCPMLVAPPDVFRNPLVARYTKG